jgi:hypothetical protein
MILCPNCLHKEIVGALFCSECGAQLIYMDGIPTSSIPPSTLQEPPMELPPKPESKSYPTSYPEIHISLNLINSGEILNLGDRNEITLGRISEGQPIIPDIDLSPYKAYEAGVSRMHASIKIKDQVWVTDLGSVNGTYINDKKIAPHIAHPLKHGDIITLGKFKIQIQFQNK